MGQPIILYGKDGETVTVYGRAEAARRVTEEGFTFDPQEPEEGAAATVEESPVTEAPPAPKPKTTRRKG